MITKLPNFTTSSSNPLWIPDNSSMLSTNHREYYKGHFHKTKVPGPDCLRAENKKHKVSAYLSTLPLSPPEDFSEKAPGNNWLGQTFQSKEVKWRRGNNLHLSQEPFHVISHYQLDFPWKRFEQKEIYIPKHIPLKSPDKFNSVTTYSTDFLDKQYKKDDICYKIKKAEVRDILTWEKENLEPITLENKRKNLPPLERSTTYKMQYQLKPITFPVIKKSVHETPKLHEPFNSKSSYQEDYNDSIFNERNTQTFGISNYNASNLEGLKSVSLCPYREYQRTMFHKVQH